jgi:YVTN family beta-propeller protein
MIYNPPPFELSGSCELDLRLEKTFGLGRPGSRASVAIDLYNVNNQGTIQLPPVTEVSGANFGLPANWSQPAHAAGRLQGVVLRSLMHPNPYVKVAAAIGSLTLTAALSAQPAARERLLLAVAQGDNSLALVKVERKTMTAAGRLPIGKGARELCVTPDGNRAYVSNTTDNTISVADLNGRKIVATLTPQGMKGPDGCGVSPDGKKLYVTSIETGTVVVLSTDTHQVLASVPVDKTPRRVLFSPDGRRIYIGHDQASTIKVIDAATNTLADTMTLGNGPRGMTFLPDGKSLLATNTADDTIWLVDVATSKPLRIMGSGGAPQGVVLSRDGKRAFVLARLEEKISIFNLTAPNQRATTFAPTGHVPWGMTISDDGTLLFVANTKDNEIAAYDTASMQVVAKVSVNAPQGLSFR